MKKLTTITLSFLTAIATAAAHAADDYSGTGYGMGHMLWPAAGHPFWGLGYVFGVLFWAAVIWILYRLLLPRKQRPEEILRARYARGNLTKRQYEKMRRELKRKFK